MLFSAVYSAGWMPSSFESSQGEERILQQVQAVVQATQTSVEMEEGMWTSRTANPNGRVFTLIPKTVEMSGRQQQCNLLLHPQERWTLNLDIVTEFAMTDIVSWLVHQGRTYKRSRNNFMREVRQNVAWAQDQESPL